jgi:DNA-binding LacI/PurR family transcriptional regulator
MAVSQKDIALRVGVDRSLVAHALRGDPRVSDATRQKVLQAALDMGYDAHSNVAARSMAAKRHGKRPKTDSIAVLLGDFVDGLPLQDLPFFREIMQGIQWEASRRDIEVAFHVLRVGRLPRSLKSGGVDGAIAVYSRRISSDVQEQKPPVPVVHLGSDTPDWHIRPDDYNGTLLLTRHLLQLGHRNIAYFGTDNGSNSERRRGYEEGLAEAGIPIREELVHMLDSASIKCGREGWRTFYLRQAAMKRRSTAVVCVNDTAAVGVIQEAQEMGLRVPEDISITGFDGLRDGYGGCSLLTTASFDRRDMGRRAVQMLCEVRDNEGTSLPQEILPVRLWKRGSTGAPPSGD